MEKADHKTLVNFIKNCEARMRMVVLFEDCVRKVELHMRYIQLQRVLQGKMAELDRLCVKERELLQGKWKTHSLPARKKACSHDSGPQVLNDTTEQSYCRPTVSTEDVARIEHQPQTQQLLLAYQYLDPRYRGYCIQSSGDYLLTWTHPHQNDTGARHGAANKGYHQTNGVAAAGQGVSTRCNKSSGTNAPVNNNRHNSAQQQPPASSHHPLCNPCVQASNQDNSSLEAYDLASPCCDPHCVPSSRRRSRQQRSKNKENQGYKEKQTRAPSQPPPQPNTPVAPNPPPQASRPTRYFNFGAGLVSQLQSTLLYINLHSCTSSELSCTVQGGVGESSAASYTTSLSTDTLYWDPPPNTCEGTRNHSSKASKPHGSNVYHHQQHQYPSTSYKPAKSWDNLTTKAFGGYGFGYGYLDVTGVKGGKGGHNRTHSTKAGRGGMDPRLVSSAHSHASRYVQPTKSTESLLLLPSGALSDSSLSCDCLDVTSPRCSNKASQTDKKEVQGAEITRL
uniref:Uncharacterized protein n=1 Tax=Timema cristinae TaxID=61476 RepID=A0A7R9DBV9_TIMCR|nr:unnamed protein product [Timema cristinae]